MTGRFGPWGRSRLVVMAGLACLTSCGWHPVYMPASSPDPGVAATLARIDVAIIPERQGQLLRQALQARLTAGDAGSSPGYVLQAGYSVSQEGLGIMPDSSVTRLRLVATSNFAVRSLSGVSRTCFSGTARAVDGLDLQDEQFFASDLETETAERRLANAVADQIVARLAIAFRHQDGAPSVVAGGTGCEMG